MSLQFVLAIILTSLEHINPIHVSHTSNFNILVTLFISFDYFPCSMYISFRKFSAKTLINTVQNMHTKITSNVCGTFLETTDTATNPDDEGIFIKPV